MFAHMRTGGWCAWRCQWRFVLACREQMADPAYNNTEYFCGQCNIWETTQNTIWMFYFIVYFLFSFLFGGLPSFAHVRLARLLVCSFVWIRVGNFVEQRLELCFVSNTTRCTTGCFMGYAGNLQHQKCDNRFGSSSSNSSKLWAPCLKKVLHCTLASVINSLFVACHSSYFRRNFCNISFINAIEPLNIPVVNLAIISSSSGAVCQDSETKLT